MLKIVCCVVLCLFSTGIFAQDFDSLNLYKTHIKKFKFDLALKELKKIPENQRSVKHRKDLVYLEIFDEVNTESLKKDESIIDIDELTESKKKELNRYYRNAQKAILDGKKMLPEKF